MAHTATIHIKIAQEMSEELRRLSKHRGQPIGELVRRALAACYQVDTQGLSTTQQQALEAYKGGFISMGKLAEIMGLPILNLRHWLNERGIPAAFS